MKLFLFVASLFVAVVMSRESDRILSLPDYGALLSANYAGYIATDAVHQSFYWFIESENDPKTDPVVLWLNGGPGCSSLLGLMEENGPYTMRHGGSFVLNEFRWTTNASILYLESPAGVGFSLDGNHTNWRDMETARASYQFLTLWFQEFPQFAGNKFFMAGESYAGHYLPQLAYEIFIGGDVSLRNRMQGFMAGNPCTGDIGCDNPDPTLDQYLINHGFASLDTSIPSANANYDPYDILVPVCDTQQLVRRVAWSNPVLDALRLRLKDAPAPYGPCADNYVTAWLNRADVKLAIHANASKTWVECGGVSYVFNRSSVTNLYELFAQQTNWSLMIYSGTADTVVNFLQTQTIVLGMKMTLKKHQFQAWYYPYYYDPKVTQLGGFFLEYDRFSWMTVNGAGHMVPQFTPPQAKELFRSFLLLGRPGRLSS